MLLWKKFPLVLLTSLLIAETIYAQQAYYYADRRRIDLTFSEEKISVKFKSDLSDQQFSLGKVL